MTSHHIDISDYEKDPRLFLFTSLTAGSSHIITATSRMETILKANKIPFQAIDLATDEKARRLWQRRAKERKLPGLVKDGFVLGDLDEIEEWNEFGELKENIGDVPSASSTAGNTVKSGVNIAPPIPVNPTATQGTTKVSQPPVASKSPNNPDADETKARVALPGAAEIAERNKPKPTPTPEQQEGKSVIDENAPPKATESMTSASAEKRESINAAKKLLDEDSAPAKKGVDHLSAPPSVMQSGTATPDVQLEEKEAEKLAPSRGVGEAAEEKSTHRGSEVKEAPADEVKKIESENLLAEAAEEEATADEGKLETAAPSSTTGAIDDGKKESAAPSSTPTTAAEASQEGEKNNDGKTAKATAPATSVDASDKGEGKVAEEVKEQSAKEPEDAGKSVGD